MTKTTKRRPQRILEIGWSTNDGNREESTVGDRTSDLGERTVESGERSDESVSSQRSAQGLPSSFLISIIFQFFLSPLKGVFCE